MLERGRGQHQHGRGSIGAEHPFGRQLLGLSPQEALAKRPLALHQEHDGTPSKALLIYSTNVHHSLHLYFICKQNYEYEIDGT